MSFNSSASVRSLSLGAAALTMLFAGVATRSSSVDAASPSAEAVGGQHGEDCQQLKGKRFGAAVVDDAEKVAKGGELSRTFMGPVSAPLDLCRVRATASPVAGSNIKIELWLPDQWNGRMLGTGGGGLNGGLGNTDKEHAAAVARGYAGVINDLGHDTSSPPGQWGYRQPQRIQDFGDRADHVAALVGKAVITDYYGKRPDRSYFQGCSGGGREALMLAQRHPGDYDGIIAGAPAADFTGLMTSGFWNSQRVQRIPDAATLPAKLGLLHDAALRRCDMLDGVADGVIGDPPLCKFDPTELQCKPGQDPSKCLGPGELEAVREIYHGPRTVAGANIVAGNSIGSELGWAPFITPNGIGATLLAVPFFQWIVLQDPKFSPALFNLDRGYRLAKSRVGRLVDATSPDLSAFVRRGGKLIIYQGWEDPAVPAEATVQYYSAVRQHMGADAKRSVRLFMLPGVGHCEGGPGPFIFDKLAALDHWTEDGIAPDRIVVSKYENDMLAKEGRPTKLVETRPIRVWPGTSRYKGSGSTNDAANFICAARRSQPSPN